MPREISLSSCGDRIALTKSSKGGVKALSRAQKKKKKGKIEGDKVHLDSSPSPPFSPSSFLSRPSTGWDERGGESSLTVFSAGRGGARKEEEGKGKLNFPRIIKNRVLLRDAE